MEYLYYFANAMASMRIVQYITQHPDLPLGEITVAHFPEGWLIQVNCNDSMDPHLEADFLAVMDEFGCSYIPSIPIATEFKALEAGKTPTEVMQRYRIGIDAHGKPNREDIEALQQQFIQSSGSYPNSLTSFTK